MPSRIKETKAAIEAACFSWLPQSCCGPLLVRDHPPHLCGIRVADQRFAVQMTFALGGLGGKNMALKSFAPLDLAGAGLFEPFCCAFVSFQFWHRKFLTTYVCCVGVPLPWAAGCGACCGFSGFLGPGT